MGSGSFPLERIHDLGKRLWDAADMVEGVCKEMESDVFSGDSGGGQVDNAASDGGSLALLRLAVRLIRDETRG